MTTEVLGEEYEIYLLNLVLAIQPDAIAVRYEDAEFSFVTPSGEDMYPREFSSQSLTRHVVGCIEKYLNSNCFGDFYRAKNV